MLRLANRINLAAVLVYFFLFCLLFVAVAAVLASCVPPCSLAVLVELRGPSALICATFSLALGCSSIAMTFDP